mgnify:CR=1 FL=1
MNRFKGEKGYALITVIITMVVLFALGSVLLNVVLGEFKKVETEKRRLQAYYVARSGAELVADSIIKDKIDAGNVVDTTTDLVNLGEGSFQAEVTKDGTNLLIESEGTVGDYTRKVALKLTSNAGSLFEDAIFAANNITIEGTAEIDGDISLKGDSSKLDITNWDLSYLNGDINFNVDKYLPDADVPSGITDGGTLLKVEDGTESINSSIHYDEVKIEGSSSVIQFVLGSDDVVLSTNMLKNEDGGTIDISTTTAFTGDARAIIFTEELKGETLAVTNNAEPEQFIIVVYGDSSDSSTIKLETGTTFKGGLYAPNKTIIIEDNVTIEGSLVADNFVIEDGSGNPSFTYAPINDENLFPISFSDLTFTKSNWARTVGDLND